MDVTACWEPADCVTVLLEPVTACDPPGSKAPPVPVEMPVPLLEEVPFAGVELPPHFVERLLALSLLP